MSNLRQAAQQAMEALWYYHATEFSKDTHAGKAIAVLQAALAEDALQRLTDVQQEMEAQQEPICPDCKAALLYECVACSRNNYPPQRKPLTDEQIEQAYRHIWRNLPDNFDHTSMGWIEQGIRYAEQAHGIGEKK